jgi:hypothetical protein
MTMSSARGLVASAGPPCVRRYGWANNVSAFDVAMTTTKSNTGRTNGSVICSEQATAPEKSV